MGLKGNIKKIALVVILFFLQEKALPQGELIPAAAKPEVVSKQLTSEEPRAAQAAPQVLTPPPTPPTPGGEAAKKIKFELNGIVLVGNRTYSDAQLRHLYQPKLNKLITVAELFEIVQSITNYYRNNGYILSRAVLPPQHVKGGVVKIQIIEGFIDKVEVIGQPYGSKCLVLGYGRVIAMCRPLEVKRMEQYLLVANEIPATQVRAVLSPSKTVTGAADLALATQTSPFTGYLSYDNYGTRYIGPQQITGNMNFNSFISSGDSTAITYTKTPKGRELTYLDMNNNFAINTMGWRGLFGGTYTHTHPLFVLQPVQIDGATNNYYVGFQFPWIRTRDQSLTFQISGNYLDSTVNTFSEKLYTDHIRSVAFGGTYNFSDRWYGANVIYADIRKGLPIWGYSKDTDPFTAQTSRPGGHANYAKVDLQASRLQAVSGNFNLYGQLKAQYAFQALLASEQYTFGGPILGRGYDVAEIIGDRGVGVGIEGRYDVPIGQFLLQSLQLYAYYDAGVIWNILVLPGTLSRQGGTSTGLGTRFYFNRYVSGNLMWTQVLTKPIAAEELIGDGKRPRWFFSIVASLA